MHEKLAAADGDIGYINNRINQFPSPVDSDTEYHRRCIALADAADEEVACEKYAGLVWPCFMAYFNNVLWQLASQAFWSYYSSVAYTAGV